MSEHARLPPGSLGLPVVGETLAFLKNPFAFLEERRARHGKVFKSSLVGRRIVFLSGIEGAEAFYDPANISREDAHPFPLVDLFGGVNMEMYDGPKHQALKAMALESFDRAAIDGYLPDLQKLIEGTLAKLAARPGGEFQATKELRRLVIEAICQTTMGMTSGPETDSICDDYGTILTGLVSIPVALPGTPYARARAARDRVLGHTRRVIGERRAAPGNDALSRMLNAKATDGRTYIDDEAALEIHHIVIAGFIVYALMAELTRRLAEDPALRARCAEEIAANVPAGTPLTVAGLAKLRTCFSVVLETKRYVPLVPLAFGRAKRTFTCAGQTVPEGWTCYLALTLNNRDPEIFRDPDRFDPDRFGPGRAEHEKHAMAFIPQGAGPATGHQCLGLNYSTFITLAFLTLLVRGYAWDLPAQDMTYRWTTIPPEPKDGLKVRLTPRPA
jgi:cytochrome P450